MKIIQIVGYKNSGKTTLATQVIERLTEEGKRVASLKHHGHGGVPLGIKDTDSEKHKRAGAVISGVEGDGTLQLSTELWDIVQMIAIYEIMHIDVLVMEGFKKHPYPKVVLINSIDDLPLLEQVENIKAVITSFPLEKVYPYAVFEKDEMDRFYDWIIRGFKLSD